MEAWVTDAAADRRSLAFRFHVSMCGSLGVGGHLIHWSEQQRAEAAVWIALYKEIRPIIQFGDQYRLRSAQAHPFSAIQYVSKDRSAAVLFAFRTHLPDPISLPAIRLRGLDPQAGYQIEGFLGEESFRSGIRDYMRKHARSNAVADDLWAALARASHAPVVELAVPGLADGTAMLHDVGDDENLRIIRVQKLLEEMYLGITKIPAEFHLLPGIEPLPPQEYDTF
jgi:hypothetical protein